MATKTKSAIDRVNELSEEEFENLPQQEVTGLYVDSVVEMIDAGAVPPDQVQRLHESLSKWADSVNKQQQNSGQTEKSAEEKSTEKKTQKKSGKKNNKKSEQLYTVMNGSKPSKKMAGATVKFLKRKSDDENRSIVEVVTGNDNYATGRQMSVKNANLASVESK